MDEYNNNNGMNQPRPNQGSTPFDEPFGAQPPVPNKRKSSGGKIAIILAVVVVLAGIGVVFASTFSKMFSSPQDRFNTAMENTFKTSDNAASSLMDFNSFVGKPVQFDVDFAVDSINADIIGSEADMLVGLKAGLGMKYDQQLKKMLLDISADASSLIQEIGPLIGSDEAVGVLSALLNDSNISIYASEDVLGIKVPFLIKNYDYITVNPQTLISDWNNSPLFSQLTELPEEVGTELITFLDAMFTDLPADKEAAGLPKADEYASNIGNAFSDMLKKSQLVDAGSVDLTIGDNQAKYDKMTYNIKGEDMSVFLDDLMAATSDMLIQYVDYLDDATGGMYSENLYEQTGMDIRELMDTASASLDAVSFNDYSIDFYISKDDRIARIEFSELTVSVETDMSDEPQTVTLGMCVDFLGENEALDSLDAKFTISAAGQNVSFDIKRNSDSSKAGINDDISFSVAAGGATLLKMGYTINWEPSVTGEDNFSLKLAFTPMMSDEVAMSITGNFVNTDKEISLSNGRVSVDGMGQNMVTLSGNMSVKEIDSSEISISDLNNKNLFDFEMEEVLTIFQEIYQTIGDYMY